MSNEQFSRHFSLQELTELSGLGATRLVPVEKDALHSRLVVIDTKEVLVSSADLDFTQMDLEFNAGIWTNNPDAVAEAIRYFDNLLKLSQGN